MSAEDKALENEMTQAVETAMEKPTGLFSSAQPEDRVQALRPAPTLLAQFEVYDRCGQELRRRIAEERTLMVAAYERQVAAYKEEIRRRLTEMKADLDRRLREHDLLTQRIMRD